MLSISRLNLRDLITGSATLGCSALLFWASNDVKDFASIGVGAAFLPRLTAILFLIVGAIIVFQGLHPKTSPKTAKAETQPEQTEQPVVFGGISAVALSIALMLIYVLLLDYLGFLLASALYVFLQILVLNKNAPRHYLKFALAALIPAVLAYVLFVNVFQISLPVGLLG